MSVVHETLPPNEPDRLAAVQRYDILDTPPDGAFDRITAIAARRFNVPISIVSIVDEDRIWFKSHHGLEVEEVGRAPGLCASAILGNEPWIVTDAKRDPRTLANPLLAGSFGLRFYAGVPLTTHDGYNLGTLCVIAREPRPVRDDEIEDLRDLASVVMDQLELRLAARRAVAQADLMAREIEHRVMNSLQFVAAVLALQARSSNSQEVIAALGTAADRVAAVARVHRHFQSDDLSELVPCLSHLHKLCEELSAIADVPIEAHGPEVLVPRKHMQSIGLMVNELVTNAAKHGASKVTVTFTPTTEGRICLQVEDDGEGLPAGFDLNHSSSGLGMKLITSLAQQLGGSVTAQPNPTGRGASFYIELPRQW